MSLDLLSDLVQIQRGLGFYLGLGAQLRLMAAEREEKNGFL